LPAPRLGPLGARGLLVHHTRNLVAAGLVLLATTLATRLAAAIPPRDLQEGIAAYNHGEMERAEALLRAALRRLRPLAEQSLAWLYIGLAQANRGDRAAARDSFVAAMTADPTVAPDPDRIPPAVVVEFHAVRRSLRGVLRVEAPEPGARVFVDDVDRGRAPVEIRLPIGTHKVRVLSADELRAFQGSAVVGVRGRASVTARLAPREGKLRLEVEPPEAQATAGDRRLAIGAAIPVPAGRHRIALRAPDHYGEWREIRVRPGETAVLRARLVRVPPAYKRRRTWGWVSLGIAGAALAGGLLVGKSARASDDAIRSGQDSGTLSYTRFQVLSAAAESNARTANVLFGVAGAAGLTGLVLVLTGGERPPPRAWRLAPYPGGISVAKGF
jgi:hypothetical protein